MYLCEFRKGMPSYSENIRSAWVPTIPQQGDIVRLGAEMYTVSARYIGMDDHVVIFVKPSTEISGHKAWVFPKRRKYDREDD